MTVKRGRKSKKRRGSAAADVLHLIYALLLIVAAALIVYFVYLKIGDISAKKESTAPSSEVIESSEEDLISEELSDADVMGLISDDSGTRYVHDDGSEAADEWVAVDGDLYFFNDSGRAVTESFSENGQVFKFDSEGKVVSIIYDEDFKADSDDLIADYPSLVKSRKLWVFLSKDKTLGNFNAIMYKKTTEPQANMLGGTENPQFSSAYSMQIDGDYIYYLPLSDSDKLSDEEKKINGVLYRMKPGAEYREIVAQNVEGYKVLDGTAYYMSSGKIYHTSNGLKDETKTVYVSDSISIDDFVFENKGDSLLLYDKAGNPVNTGEKRVGSFTYYLSDDGEIEGVREKTSVLTGGWTYYTETDNSSGKSISKIMRKSGPGEIQEVSSDFAGYTANMFYDYSSGNLVAEYMPNGERRQLIIINSNGDVDSVDSTVSAGGDIRLYALIDGSAICKVDKGGETVFESFDLSSTTPVAVGVISENIFVNNADSSEEIVTAIPPSTLVPAETLSPSHGEDTGSGIIVGGAPGN